MSIVGAVALATLLVGEAEVSNGAQRGTRMAFEAQRCGDSMRSVWRDAEQRIVAEEDLLFVGERWVRYRLQRLNVGVDVTAQRETDGIRVTIRRGEATREVRLRSAESLMVGSTLVSFLAAAMPNLRAGRTVDFDYLVADRGTSVRLRAKLVSGAAPRGAAVRLEAASPMLRPFVPPTQLQFDERGELQSMAGRLVPQGGDATNPQSLEGVLRLRPVILSANASRVQYGCNKGDVT